MRVGSLGPCPHAFGARYIEIMQSIRDDPPAPLVCQPLYPWLDQIALPLVVHEAGGGRPGPELEPLDGGVACHWRVLSLLYAREPDATVGILEEVTAAELGQEGAEGIRTVPSHDLSRPGSQGARAVRPGRSAPKGTRDPQQDQVGQSVDALGAVELACAI